MIPYLQLAPIHLGPFTIQPFGLLVCFAIVVGAILSVRRARQVGLDPDVVKDTVRLSAFFGIFGSHLVHLIAYHPEELMADPWSIVRFWSGLSSFGGFISAALAVWVYARRKRIRFLQYGDVLMFGFFPAWFIARIGCATAHDHPGRLSDFILAVRFPGGSRHDLGLYEVFLSLAWVPFVYYLGRKKDANDPPPGTIVSAMCIAYSVPRFFLDFLRATDLAYSDARYFGLTPAQYGCLALTAMGTWFLFRNRRRERGQ